ncbi:MAG: hypothetical protein K0Q49_1561 [Haloplasmataceae bacterium]|nr:hypothetical protein [Haloplasmataceae bacterium]
MKLTSKFGIISGVICSILSFILFLVMLLAYVGNHDDKVYILILFFSLFLFSTMSMLFELNHYIIMHDNEIIIKNYFKKHIIHFDDIYRIEIYKPVSTKYTTINLIKFIFKDQSRISFKYLGSPNNDYVKNMKRVFGKEIIKFKEVPRNYLFIELVAAILLAILSLVGIYYSIIDFSNFIFLFASLLLLSIVGIIYYYKKLNPN